MAGISVEELEKLAKIAALAQSAATNIFAFIQNKMAQGGKSKQELEDHAEATNKEAKKVIDSL